jgi:hypothetical protein
MRNASYDLYRSWEWDRDWCGTMINSWGLDRVDLPYGALVAPGDEITFQFTITAPSVSGSYLFQWYMFVDSNQIGDSTPASTIVVSDMSGQPKEIAVGPSDKASYTGPLTASKILSACLNIGDWETVASHTTMFGWMQMLYSDASVPQPQPWERQQCFANLRDRNIKMAFEVGVLKPGHTSGEASFTEAYLNVFAPAEADGASIDVVQMDEPFFASMYYYLGNPTWAVNETATFISRLRQQYPSVKIMSIEPYPALNRAQLLWWIEHLNAACAALGVQGVDYFVLDHDWHRDPLNWDDILAVAACTHAEMEKFGVIFNDGWINSGTTDGEWATMVQFIGGLYHYAGVPVDLYHFEQWDQAPAVTIPESATNSYMWEVNRFIHAFVPGIWQ